MARYVYEGPQPHITEAGECFRPLEVYELAEEPPFGPFRLLPDDDPVSPPEPPDPSPSPFSPPASDPAPASLLSLPATGAAASLPTGAEGA